MRRMLRSSSTLSEQSYSICSHLKKIHMILFIPLFFSMSRPHKAAALVFLFTWLGPPHAAKP